MAPDFDNNRPVETRVAPEAASESIPMFSGRPRREKIIGRDDLMDLDILLHTCDTVEAFLAKA